MKPNIKTLVILIFSVVLFRLLPAQFYYYGKNKVRESNFKWQYVETDNFKLYYYTSNLKLINEMARFSEDTYTNMSEFLNIQVEKKIPVIFYRTHIDFEQTNLYPGFLPPAAQAFAEPIAHRVVLHGDLSRDELFGTLHHELGHIFEYAIWYQNISRSNLAFKTPPLWIVEGFADFMTGGWDNFNLLTVRDAVINDGIPELTKSGQLVSRFGTNRAAYDFGHLLFDFIHEKFGDRGVRNLIYAPRRSSIFRTNRQFARIFYLSPKIFNYEFKKYARDRFKKFFTKENPEEYSYIIGPDIPYAYSFSHKISPSGQLLAVVTLNAKAGKLDIILISMKDGEVIKNITPGFTYRYDNINLKFNPADGTSFDWQSDDNRIGFFARKEWNYVFVLINVLNNKVEKVIQLENIQDPSSPDFHPDGKRLFFTGIENSHAYIYSLDIQTGATRRVSEGRRFIRSLALSPGGDRIAYSAISDGFYKLFQGPLDRPEMGVQLTRGEYNDITPAYASNGKIIYYSSDELDSYNIMKLDLEQKTRHRYTDVRTANFFPLEIPNEEDKLVISSYYKNRFLLFKKDISEDQETSDVEFLPVTAGDEPSGETEETSTDISPPKKYKPFSKFYLTALPPVTLGYSSDGSFLGSSYLQATDLMGDHNFLLYAASYYGYTNFHLHYINLENRLQYYGHLYYYREPYYYPYYFYDEFTDNLTQPITSYLTLRRLYGAQFALWYPFSRSYRLEAGASIYRQEENSDALFLGVDLPYGQFFDGWGVPLEVSLVGETTRFAYYGPNMGHTFKLTARKYISMGESFIDAYELTGDLRKYIRVDNNTVLAFRLYGFSSRGDNPLIHWTGGNNTLRAAPWRRVSGNEGFYFNAEFRFPLIRIAQTVIGRVGPLRGVLFFDMGGAWFNDDEQYQFMFDDEFRLRDGISSYGVGLQFFLFGVPIHLDWVTKWDFKEKAYYGFNFWIGLDF